MVVLHCWSARLHTNSKSHIDASLSRQPLVKGERLVRYEVNAVMPEWCGRWSLQFLRAQVGGCRCIDSLMLSPPFPPLFFPPNGHSRLALLSMPAFAPPSFLRRRREWGQGAARVAVFGERGRKRCDDAALAARLRRKGG